MLPFYIILLSVCACVRACVRVCVCVCVCVIWFCIIYNQIKILHDSFLGFPTVLYAVYHLFSVIESSNCTLQLRIMQLACEEALFYESMPSYKTITVYAFPRLCICLCHVWF